MTLWSRTLWGALIGAILTLLIHPTSRPFLASPFIESAQAFEDRSGSLPLGFPDALPEPVDDLTSSLWIHVGAERVLSRSDISDAQVKGLIQICTRQANDDPTNSFWPMAEAVFYHRLERESEASAAWQKASRCISYNDFQSRHLTAIRASLATENTSNSWQFAYAYRLRSMAFSFLVETFARYIVSNSSRTEPRDLELRYATLRNGSLMRDGARNLQIMERGISTVELASHPQEFKSQRSIKRLLIAHSEFKEALKSIGKVSEAEKTEQEYNENEGWSALTAREDTGEKISRLTLASSLIPGLPGVLLQCALLGIFILATGLALERAIRLNERFAAPLTAAIAIFVATSVWVLTHSVLALVASGLCCLFVLLTPRNPRSHLPKDLGPLFTFVMIVLACVFIFLGAVMLIGRTLPVIANRSAFSPQIATILDSNVAAGLALITVSCLFLFAPLWALAQHIRTLFVLSRGFVSLGLSTLGISLFLSVATTPVCVYLEKENQETFRMLLENEPLYYIRQ